MIEYVVLVEMAQYMKEDRDRQTAEKSDGSWYTETGLPYHRAT